MIRIFTQAFFRLTRSDQAAVVQSVVRDLQNAIGRHLDPRDDAKAERTIRRIEKKALEYGVHVEQARCPAR
jgi:hypothetical protein